MNPGEQTLKDGPVAIKTCPACCKQWHSWAELLTDPEVAYLGYQRSPVLDAPGIFLFNHCNCGGSFAVDISELEKAGHFPPLEDPGLTARSGEGVSAVARLSACCQPGGVIERRPKQSSS
jgi:hypothetical protein